ncbi:MAG: hypothetical protein QF435_12615 [Arenicellales bacterium]|nr:hypothetical protein [Arenicellales bacterium]
MPNKVWQLCGNVGLDGRNLCRLLKRARARIKGTCGVEQVPNRPRPTSGFLLCTIDDVRTVEHQDIAAMPGCDYHGREA